MKVNLDFRAEMKEWIRDYGIAVLYGRTSRMIKCSCLDPLYRAPNPRCDKCGGTGKLTRVEKLNILTQEQYSQNRDSLLSPSQVGIVYGPLLDFYFVHEDQPRVGDRVYVVGWRDKKPQNVLNVYVVEGIQSHRGDDGRIEFHAVQASTKPELRERGEELVERLKKHG